MKAWKTCRLDSKRETIFFLLNDSRLHKRRTRLSSIKEKNRIRCDLRHQMHRRRLELLLMVVNESFYTVMHDIPYFPHKRETHGSHGNAAMLFYLQYMIVSRPFVSDDSLHLLGLLHRVGAPRP